MTQRSKTELLDLWLQRDPYDWITDLLDSIAAIDATPQIAVATTTYQSATQTLVTVPANSVIQRVHVVRTTAWDAITTFEVGKAGDTDWLVTTVQADVTTAIPAGEEQAVETVNAYKGIDTATAVVLTLNQGAASQGAGYVIVEYVEEVQE